MRLIRSTLYIALVLSPSLLFAQSSAGTIVGSIKDSSGAVVPHATVTMTNLQTNRQESVTADIEGRYTSLPLPPGEYCVEAELDPLAVTVRLNDRTSEATYDRAGGEIVSKGLYLDLPPWGYHVFELKLV